MAKTQKPNTAGLEELKSDSKVQKKQKTISVKFLGMIRASYGAYDAGDVAEIDAEIARTLIENGLAKTYTPSVVEEEEM